MFAESKDEVSLVLFGTENTANSLASGDQYQHITVHRHLMLPDFDLLEDIQNAIQPGSEQGDRILSECSTPFREIRVVWWRLRLSVVKEISKLPC